MPSAARKIALTDKSLKAFKATGERAVVWDSQMPGMAVRVSALGKRSFYCVKRRAGETRVTWHLLGVYPVMGLSQARDAAREALGLLMRGESPKALAAARQEAEAEAEANTLNAIAEDFICKYLPTMRSARVYESRIRRDIIPALGAMQIATIRRRDVIALVEAVAERSGKGAATGMLAVLRQLLNWAVDRDIIDVNPAAAVRLGTILGKAGKRDRLLTDAELAAVWQATDAVGEPFGTVYRLLMLLGLRRSEVSAAKWGDFDEAAATLTIPPERSKNGEAMLVQLPPKALELIAAMPRFTGGDYIFTTTAGRAPIGALAQAKARLDAVLAERGNAVAPFVVHDFRRACRSGLGRLGVPTVTAEHILGHKQRGIVGVYDVHSYSSEKRSALAQWEAHLLSIVAPPPDEGSRVVPMRQRVSA